MPSRRLAAVAALACLLAAAPAHAAPGDLDAGFADGGISRTEAGQWHSSLADIDVAPDGRIVAVGSNRDNDLPEAALTARWESDGDLDPTYSYDGIDSIRFPVAGGSDYRDASGRAVLALPDGGVLAGARFHSNGGNGTMPAGFLARMAADASPVADWGDWAGYATDFYLRGGDGATGLVHLADGRTVAGGTRVVDRYGNFELVRLTTRGRRDAPFGTDGVADLPQFSVGPDDVLEDLDAHGDADGVVATGHASVERLAWSNRQAFAAARVRDDGSLDPGFGTGGRRLVDFTEHSAKALSAVVTADGGIVLAGSVTSVATGAERWAAARLDADGDLDPAFGDGGRAILEVPGRASGIDVDDEGRLLLAGVSADRFTVARLTSAGQLDASFGEGGLAQPMDLPSGAADVAAVGDGVVAGGWSEVEWENRMTLVKLEGDPPPPPDDDGEDDEGEDDGDDSSPSEPVFGTASPSGSAAGYSSPSAGGPVSGSADSTSGIPSRTRITGPLRGLSLRLLDRRPRKGALRARVTWAEGSRGRGEIRVHATRRGKRVLVASLRFTISGGRGAALRVPLTVTGRRIFGAIRRKGAVPVRATLKVAPGR